MNRVDMVSGFVVGAATMAVILCIMIVVMRIEKNHLITVLTQEQERSRGLCRLLQNVSNEAYLQADCASASGWEPVK